MATRSKGVRKHKHNVLKADDAPPGTFAVIDPQSKRLFVPLEAMIDTRAMHRDGVPSLCRIFLQGRCRQGGNCYQAHANGEVVRSLRAAALSEPTCCHFHGVSPGAGGALPPGLTVVLRGEGEVDVARLPAERVAVTQGLRALLEAQLGDAPPAASASAAPREVVVPVTSLCRLHAGSDGSPCCRFEGACNFVHVCREMLPDASASAGGSGGSGSASSAAVSTPLVARAEPMPEVMAVAGAVGEPVGGSTPFGGRAHDGMGITTPVYVRPPLALAATAPSNGPQLMSASPSMARSFSSTASGLVWRHNPYGNSSVSSVIET